MNNYQIFFSIFSAIILFLFGLSAFSAELKHAAGNKLETIMARLTSNRFIAFAVGLFFTSIIQSSTAVSSLAVSMVNSGVLNFSGATAIILGSYVGTTATAWLVSFKLTGIGPIFIVLGTMISALPIKAKVFGKGVFYFGFIFFSLDLVSSSISPLRESELLTGLLLYTSNTLVSIGIGVALTIVLQSSTVVTGLAIIFVQQHLITPADSIPIVLGANIGTTFTALFASIRMNTNARKAAAANTLINMMGVIMLYPFLTPYTKWVLEVAPSESMVVATAHLSFNLVLVTVFLIALNPFVALIEKMFNSSQSDLQSPE
ncbi:MAG: Na/Pi symporter [Bacteriovoracaceae bacterium]